MKNPLAHVVYGKSDMSGEAVEILLLGHTVVASTYDDDDDGDRLFFIDPNRSWELDQKIQVLEQSIFSATGIPTVCRRIRLSYYDLQDFNGERGTDYEEEDLFESISLFEELVDFVLHPDGKLEYGLSVEDAGELNEDVDYLDEEYEDVDCLDEGHENGSVQSILFRELDLVGYGTPTVCDHVSDYPTADLLEILEERDVVFCSIDDSQIGDILLDNGFEASSDNISTLRRAVREMTSGDYYTGLADYATKKLSVRHLLQKS